VVTKSRRRSQLARASAQRQQVRRAQRAVRRRRRRVAITAVVVVLAVAALVTWIVLHSGDAAADRAGSVDYIGGAGPAAGQATTAEGAR
jgi:hypothetical protein